MRRQSHWQLNKQTLLPRWKRIEAVVAVAFALSQLLSTLHFGIVRHAICPEDGELGHVARIDRFDVPAAPEPSGPIARVSAESAGWNEGGANHQHCLVQALRRQSATQIRAHVQAIIDSVETRHVELTSARPREGSGLFRLAPKHSPPA